MSEANWQRPRAILFAFSSLCPYLPQDGGEGVVMGEALVIVASGFILIPINRLVSHFPLVGAAHNKQVRMNHMMQQRPNDLIPIRALQRRSIQLYLYHATSHGPRPPGHSPIVHPFPRHPNGLLIQFTSEHGVAEAREDQAGVVAPLAGWNGVGAGGGDCLSGGRSVGSGGEAVVGGVAVGRVAKMVDQVGNGVVDVPTTVTLVIAIVMVLSSRRRRR